MAISSPPRRGGQAAPHHQRGLITVLVLAVVAVLVLAAAVVALLARGGSSGSGGVQGSGVAATQSRVVARFSRLDLAGSNNVTVVVGGRQSVVVHADSNLLGYVTTRVVAGTLVIGTTGSFTTRTPMGVEISVPSLAAVKLSGSGEISVTRIEASQLSVALSGSGALSASGTATRLDVTVGGSGLAQLSGLVARDVRGVVTGSGLIRVTATASLNAAVPGTGAIVYSGNPPQVTSSVTGTGAVIRG
jgi:Putative auto-transporter adhesin, head GIN domain